MKNLRVYLLLLASFLISSCSVAPTIYNNLDWIVYVYLDDYVDLNSSQKAFLDKRITKWHTWHRSSELEKYKVDLIALREQLRKGSMDKDEWLAEIAKAKQHLFRLRDEISPEAIEVVQQLTDDQVAELLALWEKNDRDEIKVFNEREADEELKARQSKTREFFEGYVGSLSLGQSDLVRNYAVQAESEFLQDMAYNARLRQSLKTIFSDRQGAEFRVRLASLVNDPDRLKPPELVNTRKRNEARYAQLLSELSSSLNEGQREKLVRKLASHIETIDGLLR
ncbi:DUF6279 family lipoprotein [Pseudomonas lijiangensis]|uniref:Lipoprotein n=1 Tax=Pseudomonas lijiangensis TaxID=2995658 RepID=A0ABX8HR28_9PSED|nr:DUF6279 family lipoprotein [Pseudomonas lijiangensis]MBX8522965.1 hypothetical protein [Pseudomonas cichorii]MBX8500180.1 hypothetical protein [Pseudomonas lijiangensis]MBX8505431.1 hypothetical protein [Pseudomonas lijiangensis]MBX8597870.1 hypothetical protein [Pseudomonas cichorii]QWU82488.1 hypothetical protein KQP88_21045 [Pseudomonas lijiangensis]